MNSVPIKKPKCFVIVPAGGSGSRLGSATPKQFLSIHGKPLVSYVLEKFECSPHIDGVILVAPYNDVAFCEQLIITAPLKKVKRIVVGGSSRQSSVFSGLRAVPKDTDIVLVHDAVRPFVSLSQIEQTINQAVLHKASVLAVPVKDTIKVTENQFIQSTPDRQTLFAAQTPQGFQYDVLYKAHEVAEKENFLGSDDASLVERIGIFPVIVLGDDLNLKITTKTDLNIAELLLTKRVFEDTE